MPVSFAVSPSPVSGHRLGRHRFSLSSAAAWPGRDACSLAGLSEAVQSLGACIPQPPHTPPPDWCSHRESKIGIGWRMGQQDFLLCFISICAGQARPPYVRARALVGKSFPAPWPLVPLTPTLDVAYSAFQLSPFQNPEQHNSGFFKDAFIQLCAYILVLIHLCVRACVCIHTSTIQLSPF